MSNLPNSQGCKMSLLRAVHRFELGHKDIDTLNTILACQNYPCLAMLNNDAVAGLG